MKIAKYALKNKKHLHMKTIKIFSILFLILIALSCSKNEDNLVQLPSGENTAYYYLNGNLVIPQGFGSVPPFVKPISCNLCIQPNNGIVFRLNNIEQIFSFFIKSGITSTGLYPFNFGDGNDSACNYNNSFSLLSIRGFNGAPDINYATTQNSGEVVITTLSADKRKFTGTFRATLVDGAGATIQVTGGVFNVNLDTL